MSESVKPAAWLRPGATEPISDALKRADLELYERHTVPLYTADQLTAAYRAGMLRAAQIAESMTARERWISGAINSQQAKPCKIAAAIRAEAEREGENNG